MAAQTQFWMTSVKPSSLWGLAFTNSKTTFTTLSPSRSRIRSLHFLLARTTYFSFLSLEVKMQRKEKNTFLTTCHPSCLPKKVCDRSFVSYSCVLTWLVFLTELYKMLCYHRTSRNRTRIFSCHVQIILTFKLTHLQLASPDRAMAYPGFCLRHLPPLWILRRREENVPQRSLSGDITVWEWRVWVNEKTRNGNSGGALFFPLINVSWTKLETVSERSLILCRFLSAFSR